MKTAVILCYHKVGPIAEEGRRLNIEPARLRSHVQFFSRRGYRSITARELAADWPDRSICFTFDDAYESTLRNAPSILEEAKARGSFYAVAGKVGATSDWDGELARPLASWDALARASKDGHEIGNHTVSHPHLNLKSPEEQVQEVSAAHQLLKEAGIECRSFCYPYGSLAAPDLMERTGYKVGLSLIKRIATQADPLTSLPRIAVGCGDAIPLLLYKIFVRPKLPR